MNRSDAVPHASDETLLAVVNAMKLGASLVLTWAIGIGVRLALPRFLGPSALGTLSFADAFTATFFVVLNLGVDVYVRKQVAVRTAHASDFLGGVVVLRVVLTALLLVVMSAEMQFTSRPPEVRRLVYLFALAQFFVTMNATLSALLHAKGNVDGMSILSVASKVAWGAGMLAAMSLGTGLWAFAAVLFVTEAGESLCLLALAKRHLGLDLRVDLRATRAMIGASLPYYLTIFLATVYGKLDVTLLDFLGNAREVGWYSASSTIASLTLLVTPLIGWVLMPAFARAATRSHEELYALVRSSTRIIMTVAIPISLFISLGADVWVRFLFGAAFVPAVPAVRILASTFVMTYLGIVYAMTLTMLERAWALTAVSFFGLIVNVALNLALIVPSMRAFGAGGGGAGCALAVLGTELAVTATMVVLVGRHAFDRNTLAMIAKGLAACALAVVVDRLASFLGWRRLLLDAFVYVGFVLVTGALQPRELIDSVVLALRRAPQRG